MKGIFSFVAVAGLIIACDNKNTPTTPDAAAPASSVLPTEYPSQVAPVALAADPAAAHDQALPRHELPHILERRHGSGHEAEHQVGGQRLRI